MALSVVGDSLYATGDFSLAVGMPDVRIARFDGTTWTALGSGLSDVGGALFAAPEGLYVGGAFTNAGGVPAVGFTLFEAGGTR
jgi:hypothetical protein